VALTPARSAGLPGWARRRRRVPTPRSRSPSPSSRGGERGRRQWAFQFASTNLVWELGLVLWVLIGWQFTLAEYLGGIVMIVLMSLLLRLFVNRQLEEQARDHARETDTGHQHHIAGEELSWRERLTSTRAWSDVAHNFRGDWQMLWKEITIGFLLAGFVAQFGNGIFEHLFIRHAPAPLRRSRT